MGISALRLGLIAGFWILAAAGLVLGIAALVRWSSPTAHGRRTLTLRLARGEISPDEYRAAVEAIGGPTRFTTRALVALAAAFLIIGVIGGITAAMWGWPMGDHMMGGMGSMMGGEPGRSARPPVPGAPTLRVQAMEFSFHPGELRIRVGQTVNIELDNAGGMFHTFTIEDLHFELRAASGQRMAGALKPEKLGGYRFICAVPGHASSGMRGTVLVTT